MPTSAERSPRRRGQGGFTLLEIMATVAIIGVVLLPILGVREQSTSRIYRSTGMLEASRHAQEFLATRLRNPASSDGEHGVIEADPAYRYEFTIEDYDLSLGYSDDEELEDRDGDGFPDDAYKPGDSSEPEEAEEPTPHKWRRYELTISWDGYEDETEDTLVLEGFVPRIWEERDELLEDDE